MDVPLLANVPPLKVSRPRIWQLTPAPPSSPGNPVSRPPALMVTGKLPSVEAEPARRVVRAHFHRAVGVDGQPAAGSKGAGGVVAAVDDQSAAVDGGWPSVGFNAGEGNRAGAIHKQGAGAGDDPGQGLRCRTTVIECAVVHQIARISAATQLTRIRNRKEPLLMVVFPV